MFYLIYYYSWFRDGLNTLKYFALKYYGLCTKFDRQMSF